VGQLGNNELSAFSVNSSIFTFAFLVFNFLSTATTPAVATALATNDRVKVRLLRGWSDEVLACVHLFEPLD
jgi:Na+-driven multidrug efflux pump